MVKRSIITWMIIVAILIMLFIFDVISYTISISVFIGTTVGIISMILALKKTNRGK